MLYRAVHTERVNTRTRALDSDSDKSVPVQRANRYDKRTIHGQLVQKRILVISALEPVQLSSVQARDTRSSFHVPLYFFDTFDDSRSHPY